MDFDFRITDAQGRPNRDATVLAQAMAAVMQRLEAFNDQFHVDAYRILLAALVETTEARPTDVIHWARDFDAQDFTDSLIEVLDGAS